MFSLRERKNRNLNGSPGWIHAGKSEIEISGGRFGGYWRDSATPHLRKILNTVRRGAARHSWRMYFNKSKFKSGAEFLARLKPLLKKLPKGRQFALEIGICGRRRE